MACEWTATQRQGWLCSLYGSENSDGTRSLQPDTIQSRLLDVLSGLISHRFPPEDAATRTAGLILSQADISEPWANLLGLVLNAAEMLNDEEILSVLVDFVVELASLPDAINEGSVVKTTNVGGGEIWHTQPGQVITFAEGRLWRDLPTYSWNVTEHFQGPEQYLKVHGGHSTPLEAMQQWKNFNTYLALMAVHAKAQTIPVLADKARLGLRTLAMALEYSPSSRLGKNSDIHAPAAAQWLRIAGAQIERHCQEETEREMTGDLWQSRDGTDVCDSARLAFWKSRSLEM